MAVSCGSSKHLNNSLNNTFTALRLVLILTIPLFFLLYTSTDQDKETLHLLLVIFFYKGNLAALSLLLPKLKLPPSFLIGHQQEVQLCRDSQIYAVYVPAVAHAVAHTLTLPPCSSVRCPHPHRNQIPAVHNTLFNTLTQTQITVHLLFFQDCEIY